MASVSVSWQEVDLAVTRLAMHLTRGGVLAFDDVKRIYALGRGGMVPTRLLSGAMHQKKVGFIEPHLKFRVINNSLICDDIFDTGDTYRRVRKKCPPGQLFGFLFSRQKQIDDPNVFYGTFIDHPEYIVFPWERGITD